MSTENKSKYQTPAYIKSLVMPGAKSQKPTKKVWGIDLDKVWIPFFVAENAQGDTDISREALGFPLRIQFDKSGDVRYSQSGRPIIRVAKELSQAININQQNYIATLVNHTSNVRANNSDAFNSEVKSIVAAGEYMSKVQSLALANAIKKREQAKAEAEAEAKAEAEAEAEAEAKLTAEITAKIRAEMEAEYKSETEAKQKTRGAKVFATV